MVPECTHTASGETLVCAPWADAKRASSVGICLEILTLKPRSGPTKPTNGFVVRTGIYTKRCVMLHHWNLTKKEIEDWLDRNIHEFTAQENGNS